MGLTYQQLQQLWVQNGGNVAYAPLMAAIGLAESGGNPTSLNPTDNNGKQSSFGIWQISNGTHNPPSPNWSDPNVNAQLAVQKFNSQGLGAWGTYTSGAYRKYYDPTNAIGGIATPLNAGSNVANSSEPATTGAATAVLTSDQTSAANSSGALTSEGCAFNLPTVGGQKVPGLSALPGIGNWFKLPSVGGQCLVSKSTVRRIIGGMVLTGGAFIMLAGLGFSIRRRLLAPPKQKDNILTKQAAQAQKEAAQAQTAALRQQQQQSAARERKKQQFAARRSKERQTAMREEGKLQRTQEREQQRRMMRSTPGPADRSYGAGMSAEEMAAF